MRLFTKMMVRYPYFFSNYTGTYAGGDQLICGCRADAPGTGDDGGFCFMIWR